jgi:DNA-binding NtrC family response regulator
MISLKLQFREMQDKLITVALGRTGGHRVMAAKLLGISERGLYRKIAERIARDEECRPQTN